MCLLECGHWVRIRIDRAKRFSVVSCRFDGETIVTAVNSHEWHIRCRTLGCNFGRWVGASRQLADAMRSQHEARRGHTVGMTWDRVTWDGRGSVYRPNGDKPKAAPTAENLLFNYDVEPPY
jgi:hypothetical protein